MTKAFGIEEKRAGRPVPTLVGEHALEHEDLLSVGMIVRGEPRTGLVAHDGSDLARLGASHQMHALTPYRRARARRPLHPGGVYYRADGEIAVDCTAHHVRFSRAVPRSWEGIKHRPARLRDGARPESAQSLPALLCSFHFNQFTCRGRRRNRLSLLFQSFQMEFNSIANQ